ncbi:MAG TPA: alpha/beta fold hydrolase [Myxococcota bacterium]|nr:alpha/beta fold hydrolase [Myxococcota bacterium]
MRAGYLLAAILVSICGWLFWPRSGAFTVDETLYAFQDGFLEMSSQGVIHYVDEGEGPVILLLHGNPTWSFLYRKMIPGLAEEHRVIAPDYPGFGLSKARAGFGFTAVEQAAVMDEFLSRMDLREVTLFVQDWGGPIGLFLAERNPDRIQRLVIGNTWAWPIERDSQRRFSQIMGGPVGKFIAWCCNGIVRLFFARGVVTPLSQEELRMYLAPFETRASRTPHACLPCRAHGRELLSGGRA